MPLIVDPSFTPPPPPEVLTSPDGIVSAKVDGANAGVLLKADYTGADPMPTKVRFVRGDGLVVRSGDPAYAPGGVAVAYDLEAPVGGAVSYHAVPIFSGGSEGAASDTVAVDSPWAWDNSQVWLKSPTNPTATMRVRAATFDEDGRDFRTTLTPIQGARLPVSTSDVTGGLAGTLTVRTETKEEYDALVALMDGSVLLIQAHPVWGGVPVMYVRPTGKLTSDRMGKTGFGWGLRSWSLQVAECRRPSTVGSPLVVPGVTYESVASRFSTYEELAAQVPSYLALLGW